MSDRENAVYLNDLLGIMRTHGVESCMQQTVMLLALMMGSTKGKGIGHSLKKHLELAGARAEQALQLIVRETREHPDHVYVTPPKHQEIYKFLMDLMRKIDEFPEAVLEAKPARV